MSLQRRSSTSAAFAFSILCPIPLLAGGGGENMLLVVNPNDESSLRIANEYAKLRSIPSSNIVYITPTAVAGYTPINLQTTQFASTYQTPILNAISQRGLSGQIDYIGVIGGPNAVAGSYKDPKTNTFINVKLSMNYALGQMTQFQNGMTYNESTFRESELYQNRQDISTYGTTYDFTYSKGTNAAIHHSQQLTPAGPTGSATSAQWYMSGTIAYTGMRGNTPAQAIANLQRTAAADGSKPGGKVYFEANTDVRSTTRAPYWPAVQSYMTANGISWAQHNNSFGAPKNMPDVRGAVIGASTYTLPNGSTYLPGSWADSLTSSGGQYGTSAQTKAGAVLAAGAGGSSGTISEPFAFAQRFPMASLFVYHNEGSTLGEAFYKSVRAPDMIMFQGDMLSQAYADLPSVSFTSAPANLASVSGSISVGAQATLSSPAMASDIDRLELFVDGKRTAQSVSGSTGAFNIDTTSLTDGVHEIRVVAYNNSQAASQSSVLSNVVVNNKGQSVAVSGGGSYAAASNQTLVLPVSAAQGSGPSVTGIQLQSLGRVVGSTSGTNGNISLNAAALAYGENIVVPVATLSDGSQVRGLPITVNRAFNQLVGRSPTLPADRTSGFTFKYFGQAAGQTLATTDFAGTPNYTIQSNTLQISPDNANSSLWNMPDEYRSTAGGSNAGLAISISGAFNVAAAGEYAFAFDNFKDNWSSFLLTIDGQTVSSYDLWNGASFGSLSNGGQPLDTLRSVYLLPGEHDLQVYLANFSGSTDANSQFALWYRDVNGTTALADATNFYSVVPEPSSALMIGGVGAVSLLRKRRRPERPQ